MEELWVEDYLLSAPESSKRTETAMRCGQLQSRLAEAEIQPPSHASAVDEMLLPTSIGTFDVTATIEPKVELRTRITRQLPGLQLLLEVAAGSLGYDISHLQPLQRTYTRANKAAFGFSSPSAEQEEGSPSLLADMLISPDPPSAEHDSKPLARWGLRSPSPPDASPEEQRSARPSQQASAQRFVDGVPEVSAFAFKPAGTVMPISEPGSCSVAAQDFAQRRSSPTVEAKQLQPDTAPNDENASSEEWPTLSSISWTRKSDLQDKSLSPWANLAMVRFPDLSSAERDSPPLPLHLLGNEASQEGMLFPSQAMHALPALQQHIGQSQTSAEGPEIIGLQEPNTSKAMHELPVPQQHAGQSQTAEEGPDTIDLPEPDTSKDASDELIIKLEATSISPESKAKVKKLREHALRGSGSRKEALLHMALPDSEVEVANAAKANLANLREETRRKFADLVEAHKHAALEEASGGLQQGTQVAGNNGSPPPKPPLQRQSKRGPTPKKKNPDFIY
ncbi:hypothetical protein WJX74_004900 [Apatococcus lobatus]|uniref:Uncharacterized protein n=1 Tax=Apatococcus lobatus TaxID=904363 RepID=A0AAW1RPI4_9CHLO